MKEIHALDFRDTCNSNIHVLTVYDLLFDQLKKYYEPAEDVNPPVKLELCITAQGDQIYLSEPLVSDTASTYMYI